MRLSTAFGVPDGSDPLGALVNVNGELYGTMFYDGK